MTTQAKIISAKTPAPSRTRVKELAIARLEALTEKQRLRQPRSRCLPSMDARAERFMAQLTAAIAKSEAQRKKESAVKQIRVLTEHLCSTALGRKRQSLKAAQESAWIHRMMDRSGGSADGFPRLKNTNLCLRCFDRAEALLTRLVWQWAIQEARKEMETQEADAS